MNANDLRHMDDVEQGHDPFEPQHLKAKVVSEEGMFSVIVNGDLVQSFDLRSDDYAYTNAVACANAWNKRNGLDA